MSGLVFESRISLQQDGSWIARVWRYRGRRERYFERSFDSREEADKWTYHVGWKGKEA